MLTAGNSHPSRNPVLSCGHIPVGRSLRNLTLFRWSVCPASAAQESGQREFRILRTTIDSCREKLRESQKSGALSFFGPKRILGLQILPVGQGPNGKPGGALQNGGERRMRQQPAGASPGIPPATQDQFSELSAGDALTDQFFPSRMTRR